MNKVYGTILSPFVRKVILALEFKQVPYELEPVLPFRTPESFVALNPLRKVPAFVDEDIVLADSSVICDYIEQKYPDPALYPKNRIERARVLWIEEYADSHLQPLFHTLIRRSHEKSLVEESLAGLSLAQSYFESQLGAPGFLVGQELTIVDLTVPGMFLTASYAKYELDAERWPKLAAYLKQMYSHRLYVRRIDEERAELAKIVLSGSRSA